MILQHTKKKMTIYTVLAIVWTVLAFISFLDNDRNFTKYSYALVAILNIIVLILYKTNGYASVKDGVLSTGDIKKKKIVLTQITSIQKQHGDVVLISPTTKIGLNPKDIRPEDWLAFLNLNEIKRLDTSNI